MTSLTLAGVLFLSEFTPLLPKPFRSSVRWVSKSWLSPRAPKLEVFEGPLGGVPTAEYDDGGDPAPGQPLSLRPLPPVLLVLGSLVLETRQLPW